MAFEAVGGEAPVSGSSAAAPRRAGASDDFLERLQLVEPFETVSTLGSGSSSTCYLMRRDDGTQVVQKRIPVSHMSGADQEKAEREVNILASLDHPHIIRYEKAYVTQGSLVIVTEHASGGDLAKHLASLQQAGKRLPLPTALDWGVQLLLALKYMHSRRVLHRDIAIKNIFLTASGLVKLGDFGVSRVLDSTAEMALTKVGTPCYISPERCEGKPYSYASDVWGFGCVLHELATMRPAFAADAIPLLARKIMRGELNPTPAGADDECPAELMELIRRVLAVQESARPSIDQLLDEPLLRPYTARHAHVLERFASQPPLQKIPSVDIPLVGYEGCSKTTFAQRPIFVDGGRRVVEEEGMSEHEQKLVANRQRRQRQVAGRRVSSSTGTERVPSPGGQPPSYSVDFSKPMNFGTEGIVGFLKAQRAAEQQQRAEGHEPAKSTT